VRSARYLANIGSGWPGGQVGTFIDQYAAVVSVPAGSFDGDVEVLAGECDQSVGPAKDKAPKQKKRTE
jgi:hypothetical protein